MLHISPCHERARKDAHPVCHATSLCIVALRLLCLGRLLALRGLLVFDPFLLVRLFLDAVSLRLLGVFPLKFFGLLRELLRFALMGEK